MKFNKKTMQKIGLGALVMGTMLLIGNVAMASETGVWTTLSVSGNLTKNLTLNVGEELRFGDIAGPTLSRQHTDIGVTSQVSDIVNVGVGYRNVSTGEQRVSVSFGLRLLTGTINLDSLSKLELRDGDTIRGRTSLSAVASVAGVAPFVSDEVFVDDSGVTGNRATIGVSKSLTNSVGVNAFYMLNSAIGDTTTSAHILGLGLSVSL
jgi:hypothetical protein